METKSSSEQYRERLGAGADMRAGSIELARRRRDRLREELHAVNAQIHRATERDRWERRRSDAIAEAVRRVEGIGHASTRPVHE